MNAIFLLAFWLFLLAALAIGWQAGDWHDRKAILAIAAAAALSAATHMFFPESIALALVALVDVALLAVIVRYALSSRKYWPIWFSACHATTLLFELAALFLPGDQHIIAERVAAFWSIPALLVMVAGLIADQRRGVTGPKP
ncbi:hypothetical protein [Qipengyuania qiaonensis]|uniref:Uncharacterized protein n=1 Tax=Qipengyuania qiaonensis TaxID=2867240 RepID=A0ABS7J649_9SPHN|nr:hypothetical protein [Qipengyuania qiaonensis]MBX7482792.1 hypothetical protein [Qipengyuania qiaonensis]